MAPQVWLLMNVSLRTGNYGLNEDPKRGWGWAGGWAGLGWPGLVWAGWAGLGWAGLGWAGLGWLG